MLREKVGIHRWGATLAGFGGALVIIRPGVTDVSLPILLVVLSSALYAGAWSSVKILTRTDSAAVTVFWMNLLMLPLTAIPMVFVWVTPGPEDLLPIVVMALSGWAAHFCQARAFEAADASAVMPFDFLRLPLGALFGYLLFAELIDGWTWAGAVVIFLAGYYITRRESLKKYLAGADREQAGEMRFRGHTAIRDRVPSPGDSPPSNVAHHRLRRPSGWREKAFANTQSMISAIGKAISIRGRHRSFRPRILM